MQFDLHRSLFYYTGLAKTLVNAFKFQRQVRLARLFADLLSEECRQADISAPVCPIPSHPWNRRRRGFSTADRLVRCMRKRAEMAEMPVARLLGRRISRQQKALDYSSRKANVEGMFALRTAYLSTHMARRLERVILVDDVFTTGATVSECARVLKEAGVKFVGVVTLAMEL
jgi:ComF family protein